jgi:hypothetical protein
MNASQQQRMTASNEMGIFYFSGSCDDALARGYDSLAVGVNSRNGEMHVFAGLRGRRLLLQAGSPTALPCAHPTKVIRFSPLCPKGSSRTVLHCAHQIQMAPPSSLVISQGWGLIDLPLRASNEGLLRPRVARAQKINSLHPLPFNSRSPSVPVTD